MANCFKQKWLQTLTISPFWSDAEQFKVPSKQPLAAPLHFYLPFLGSSLADPDILAWSRR
jgi:hypothetical protein